MPITCYRKNCLDFLPKLKSKSVDLVVVDPPYGIRYKKWDVVDFVPFTETWVKECFKVLKPTGTLWSFMGYSNLLAFIPLLQKYGTVHLENWVVWARQKGRGSSKHLKSTREDILHVTKSSKKFTWNDVKLLRDVVWAYKDEEGKPRGWFINEKGERKRWTGLGNVWVYTCPFWNSKGEDAYMHPAQKPLAMIERLILMTSNPGDLVLDPFMGSGTTGVACKNLDRSFIGIEIDKRYYNRAKKRIK